MKFYQFVDDHRLLFGKKWTWQGDDEMAERQADSEWREVQDWIVEYVAAKHSSTRLFKFVAFEDDLDKRIESTPNLDATVQHKVSYQHSFRVHIGCEDTFNAFKAKWWDGVEDYDSADFFKRGNL